MAYFSSAYIPLLSAFAIGFTASFNEEVIFRLFGISLTKKYLLPTTLTELFLIDLIIEFLDARNDAHSSVYINLF